MLNSTRLLFDLQQVNDIGQSISGCLDADVIANQITEALVVQFDCAFARLWLMQPDQQSLRLVASSGLYTHINGSFAQVPMGAYKVGKIAQNRVPFLSNRLADEAWVKDRDWAIANNIQGFAGYPLIAGDRVLGVLATFSHQTMAPEFLEVLQVLCLTATIALDAALQAQQNCHEQMDTPLSMQRSPALSDQLATVLNTTRLMLVGTERQLTPSMAYVIVRSAELLEQLNCSYCRLTYGADDVSLGTIIAQSQVCQEDIQAWIQSEFDDIRLLITWLGGMLRIQSEHQNRMIDFLLKLPAPSCQLELPVYVQCRLPTLQAAFTHLCRSAGLTLYHHLLPHAVVLTDQAEMQTPGNPIIWIQPAQRYSPPTTALAVVNLEITPEQLHQVVARVYRGDVSEPLVDTSQRLSEREHEVMTLLAQGRRDRDIAQQLYISESTVKFHINNTLTKLRAKNRYQAVYEATIRSWI
ncbi:MAG: GAF domain-containing protein [Cyanothece sp. SIO1E1]|nr:GAF domain-containing protein [Cyanothece sp. SIO1E1]